MKQLTEYELIQKDMPSHMGAEDIRNVFLTFQVGKIEAMFFIPAMLGLCNITIT